MIKLILIRGLPGSGKSTLAKNVAKLHDADHFEADMFFTDESGRYVFDVALAAMAHDWCRLNTIRSMYLGRSVVVANTFTRLDHIKPYQDAANQFCAAFQVIECKEDYGSIHNVPAFVLSRMRKEWEELPV